ncbi:MAG: hypothetical protein AB8B55_07110 [Mariniblastus sp.]
MISPYRSTVVGNPILRTLLYIWVSPNSVIGLIVGVLGLASGGKCQIQRGCFEFSGGLVTWLLRRLGSHGVLAMTLGHTIIGQDESGLAAARDHEQVHVRQYERWGPLFLPAYLGCSAYLWLRKKDCYRGNPFEVQAYGIADPRFPNKKNTNSSET